MESIIKDTMTAYLDMRVFYNSCQHGFVKGRSTLTNLLETLDSWTRLLDEGLGYRHRCNLPGLPKSIRYSSTPTIVRENQRIGIGWEVIGMDREFSETNEDEGSCPMQHLKVDRGHQWRTSRISPWAAIVPHICTRFTRLDKEQH